MNSSSAMHCGGKRRVAERGVATRVSAVRISVVRISSVRGVAKRTALVVFGLLGMLLAGSATSQAQHEHAPFVDEPLAISAAFGAEMAVIRLQAARALLAEGSDDDDVEEVLEGLELELMRFGARVAAQDAGLADDIEEAFEEAEDAGDSSDLDRPLELARRAREIAFPQERLSETPFTAAIATLLLNSGSGVAEGYEEAIEGEVGAYAMGWAGLARVEELWRELRPVADENQIFEIEDMLGEIGALFPGPLPPSLEGADPEEGEGAAVHIAGFLEDATGASLFPDRDLAALAGNTRDVARGGCEAYSEGERLQGDARLAWTAFVFDEYLGGTLGLFAPDATETMGGILTELVPREVEDEGSEDDDEKAGRLDPAEAAERCWALLDAFDEAGAPLGL